jgi:hypothetical protein
MGNSIPGSDWLKTDTVTLDEQGGQLSYFSADLNETWYSGVLDQGGSNGISRFT